MASERELGIREILERAQTELLQPHERRSPPESLCLGQEPRGELGVFGKEGGAAFSGEPLEAPAVDRLFRRVQLIAGRGGREHRAAIDAHLEHVAEPGDVNLQGVLCPRRRALAPERVDQVLAGNRAVRLERERKEHLALIPARDRNDVRSAPHLERAENPVLEPHFDCSASFSSASQASALSGA